jgi:polyvinyl alcohol dehydrogenase (cytochrome)
VPLPTNAKARRRTLRMAAMIFAALLGTLAPIPSAGAGEPASADDVTPPIVNFSNWTGWNNRLTGTRFAYETQITQRTAGLLQLKWAFQLPRAPRTMGKSQPAVVDGTIYFGSTDGNFYALDAKTGKELWRFDTTTIIPNTAQSGAAIWDGPTVVGNRVYFGGTQGYLIALDKTSGALVWASQLDKHPMQNLTSSPVFYQGKLFVGMSGSESGAPREYPCCTFRGSVIAVDANTGQIAWQYYTVPEPKAVGTWPSGATMYAPSGGAVWGTPTIDPSTGTLYVGTGQNYTGNEGDFDSLLALNVTDGKVKWKRKMIDIDDWRLLCRDPSATGYCPGQGTGTALDFDIGAMPNLFSVNGRKLVGVGQKTGVYHVFDASTGEIVWQRQLGNPVPNGGDGGIQWGASYDGSKLYVATYMAKPGTLFALDPANGNIVWQTPSPANGCAWGGAAAYPQMCVQSHTPAVTTSAGLVYLGSMDGKFRVYNSDTGQVIWEYDTVRDFDAVNGPGRGSAISGNGGAVVANGMVYVQSGYYPFYPSPADKGYVLLAFGL